MNIPFFEISYCFLFVYPLYYIIISLMQMVKQMANTKNSTSSHTNYSSDKLLSLIELMAAKKESSRLMDLAAELHMPPSTILRFLNALMNRNYVAQESTTGRYYLTYKLCGISDSVRSNSKLQTISLPYMQELSKTTEETVNLCVEYNMMVMYIESVPGLSKALVSQQYIGHIAPMHCTAVGKLMLLNYDSKLLKIFLDTKGLPRYTDTTITDVAGLSRELASVRSLGYAYDDEECEAGLCCVGVPIYDYTRRIVAGISISGPTVRMGKEMLNKCRDLLFPVANNISMNLGYSKGN